MPLSPRKAVTSKGQSASWSAQQKNVVRIFNLMAEDDEELLLLEKHSWHELDEETLCAAPVYERFAYFLLYTYEPDARKSDEFLDGSTVKNYLGSLINLAADKFKAVGTDATKRFFNCLDTSSTSEEAKWLRGLKANIIRVHIERAKLTGKPIDRSETPIGLKLMKLVSAAYMRAGAGKLAAQAATRNFALDCWFKAAGRSSETACCIWDSLEWDFENECVFIEIVESKKSKLKLIAYVAGADRHADWFIKLGDYLVLHEPPIYNSDEPVWLVPELHGSDSPGTKLGDFLKALRPAPRGADAYAEFAVKELPDSVNAGGICPGCSNMLTKYMPGEYVVHVTGHELKGMGALYEYVDADRALALIGALVLAGWPPLPYGHHGDGPVPPSLEALCDAGAVDMRALDSIIDILFHLDSASPPMLLVDQALRPMVHASFASMIMYHDARVAAGEARQVTTAMYDAFTQVKMAGVPALTFSEWGSIIRHDFDTRNLHLTVGAKVDSGTAQIVRALGRTLTEVKGELATIRKMVAEGARTSEAAPPFTPNSAGRPSILGSPSILDAQPPTPQPAAVAAAGSSAFGSLLPMVGAAPAIAPVSWAGTSAGDYYRNVKARGGAIDAGLGKQDKKDAQTLVQFFDAIATTDEKAILAPTRPSQAPIDEGERRRVAERLQKLMVARFSAAFTEAGLSVPLNLGKGLLPTSGIANRQKELKPKGIIFDSSTFAEWRKQYEAAAASEAPPSAKRARV